MTNKEIKAAIKELTGYTETQYNKEYDLLRNKVRNYERITGTQIHTPVNRLLYELSLKEAYAKPFLKPAYTPLQAAILSTTSANVKAKLSQAQYNKQAFNDFGTTTREDLLVNLQDPERYLNAVGQFAPQLAQIPAMRNDFINYLETHPESNYQDWRQWIDNALRAITIGRQKARNARRRYYGAGGGRRLGSEDSYLLG